MIHFIIIAALKPYPLRLLGGLTANHGLVQIAYNNTWGGFCNSFDNATAVVACRQLGYSNVRQLYNPTLLNAQTVYWLDQLQCFGNESAVSQCQYGAIKDYRSCGTTGFKPEAIIECGGHYCRGGVCPANATCYDLFNYTSYYCQCPNGYYGGHCEVGPIKNGAVRLRNFANNMTDRGFVEVYVNNHWGTVCSIGLTQASGNVLCRAVGLGPLISIINSTAYGRGTQKIEFSDLTCQGNENSPLLCDRTTPVPSKCTHDNDATIICRRSKYCAR